MKYKILFVAFIFHLCNNGVLGQIDYNKVPEVTNKILINDVIVQKNPNDSIGLCDILIDNGLIVNISKNITPPIDAKVIEADSSYAYAGFIDCLSHTAVPKNESKRDRPQVKFTGFPPNDLAGITPEYEVINMIDHNDGSLKECVEAGITLSHIVPRGRMLPGQGALILNHGESKEGIILQKNSSTFFQLSGARGLYPNTIIGVMAKWRDLINGAKYHSKNISSYKMNSSGTNRPLENKTIQALIPVTKNTQAVYMKAPKAKDIYRGLSLKNEMGYDLVLSEVKQLGASVSKIKKMNIPVLLSMKLPKEEKSKKDTAQVDKKIESFLAKKEKSYKTYLSQAASLEKENIPFGFSFIDGKAKDLHKNIIMLMEHGLTKKGALASLTTTPAELLGISHLVGTLENGKLANIVISDKPYFEKEANIKYVFVEGKLTKIKSKEKKKGGGKIDDESKKTILGTWSYTVVVFDQEQEGIIEVKEGSSGLDVVLTDNSTPNDPDNATDVEWDDNTLTFEITVDGGGMELPVTISMEIDGESFSGTANIENIGAFEIEGSKISSPE